MSAAPMLPLEGIRVVEVAQNLAGPMAAEILAHMGADVINVERPEGDDARSMCIPSLSTTSRLPWSSRSPFGS